MATGVTLGELADDIKQDMLFAEGQGRASSRLENFHGIPCWLRRHERPIPNTQAGRSEIRRRLVPRPELSTLELVDSASIYFGWEDADDEWVLRNQIRNSKTAKYAGQATVNANWGR